MRLTQRHQILLSRLPNMDLKSKSLVPMFAAVVLLSAMTTSANATYCRNGATNYPKCDNNWTPPPAPTPTPTTIKNHNQASANSAANADSSSVAGASASARQQQGQAQSNHQDQTLRNAGNSEVDVIDSSSSRSSMWVFPAPVFTPPLPLIQGCPGANVDQSALALGWNFFSHAKAVVNTDNCTAITLYNSYVSTCKYQSAQQVLNLLTKKILPAFQQSDVVLIDLSKQDCDNLSRPIPQPAPNYLLVAPAPKAKPVPCPKGQRRNNKGVCYTPKPPCPENSKLMCTPTKPVVPTTTIVK